MPGQARLSGTWFQKEALWAQQVLATTQGQEITLQWVVGEVLRAGLK